MSRKTIRRGVRIGAVCAVVCVVGSAAGCYERVVGASGFGADSVNVTKPNGPDTTSSSSKTFTYKKSTVKQIPAPGAPEE